MNICVLADCYPSTNNNGGIFVAQLCDKMVDLGHEVVYIAPQSLTKSFIRKKGLNPSHFYHKTKKGNIVIVYQPYIITFGNIRFLKSLNRLFFKHAVFKVLKKCTNHVDVFYGHFWHNAYVLYQLIKNTKKPLFVATGESEILLHKKISNKQKLKFCNYVRGVICVSSKNKSESIEKGLTVSQKCIVVPNSVDMSVFCKKDKAVCRKKLHIVDSDFVIAFVGAFTDRKGVQRLSDAIKRLQDPNIKVFFIGQGGISPDCDGIIYCGFLSHSDIVDYLNSADIFVLPTLAEGCCNAIIEAMACGLPIVSSDLPFNYDVLNRHNSILIDPNNECEIMKAIRKLQNNTNLREKLGRGALLTVEQLTLERRSNRICDFIKDSCGW